MKKTCGNFFGILLFLALFEMLTPVYAANTCDEFMVVIMNRTDLDLNVLALEAPGVGQESKVIPKGTSYGFKSGDSQGRTLNNTRYFEISKSGSKFKMWTIPASKQYCGTEDQGFNYYYGYFNDIDVRVTTPDGTFRIYNKPGTTNCYRQGATGPQCNSAGRGIIQLDVVRS